MTAFANPLAAEVWRTRYRFAEEPGIDATWSRVARALAAAEPRDRATWERRFADALADFRFLPGGRILAGAGTARRVTLFNCFVMGPIEDSLDGIFSALREGALTSTDRLKRVSTPGARFAATKASMSGWSQARVAIMAPRRAPVDWTVAHIASHTCMKLTGPDATVPASSALAPDGRSVEKSMPMPPPCCIVSAPSRSAEKMPSSESSIGPITKQLNSVTRRPVPAPARMRPPGRKRKSASASANRRSHVARSRGSAAASARATRDHVASMPVSSAKR